MAYIYGMIYIIYKHIFIHITSNHKEFDGKILINIDTSLCIKLNINLVFYYSKYLFKKYLKAHIYIIKHYKSIIHF